MRAIAAALTALGLLAQHRPVREIVTGADGRVIEERGRPGPAPSGDRVIDKAREVAFEFSNKLPDFICEQLTWRFQGAGRRPSWKLKDRVLADLAYMSGRESYSNIRVNGKPLKKGSPPDTGTWSTGEYGTMQLDVLADNTNARFTYDVESQVGGRKARKYRYTVEQANSHWLVDFEGRRIYPAFEGGIWIDAADSRVLRVERAGREIPADYPLNVFEMTVDYGLVRIAGQDYVLPVKSENLACFAASLNCTRNEIEFRNYRKFSVGSTVTATDSSVTFESETGGAKPEYTPPSISPEKPRGKRDR